MIRLTALSIVLSLFTASAVFAFNYRDLRTAPIAWFNDRDMEMMTEAFNKAMDNNDDGASTEWSNDDTGHHGTITPLDTSRQGSQTCRRARVENYAGSNHGITRLKFCRNNGEPWQISE